MQLQMTLIIIFFLDTLESYSPATHQYVPHGLAASPVQLKNLLRFYATSPTCSLCYYRKPNHHFTLLGRTRAVLTARPNRSNIISARVRPGPGCKVSTAARAQPKGWAGTGLSGRPEPVNSSSSTLKGQTAHAEHSNEHIKLK